MHISTNKIKYSFFTLLFLVSLHAVASEESRERQVLNRDSLQRQLRKNVDNKSKKRRQLDQIKQQKKDLKQMQKELQVSVKNSQNAILELTALRALVEAKISTQGF